MRKLPHSVYARIAVAYLLLLISFCAVTLVVTGQQMQGFLEEIEQRLNRDLADHLAQELKPDLVNGFESRRARDAAARIAGLNPSIDQYVLDQDGRVVAAYTAKPATRAFIDIRPVNAFLKPDAMFPLHAADPGAPDGEKVFSAARLEVPAGKFYLFVILRGMPVTTTASLLRSSYVLRGVSGILVVVVSATALAGLLLFFLLTQRLNRLIVTVRELQAGRYDQRALVESGDEIGRLAAAFNDMAATIEQQFEALRTTDEMRREFAQNISHDLRTPLTSVHGHTQRLLEVGTPLNAAQRAQHLRAIAHSAAEMDGLAQQLAAMVELDGHDRTVRREPFSLTELLQDAAAKFMPAAEAAGVRLHLQPPRPLPMVLGDISQVERALSNLIDNAIKHSPPGGRVWLAVESTGKDLRVLVRDEGPGIPEDEVHRVTQRFYRTRQSRATRQRGSGLGLAIASEIIEKNGGRLSLNSSVGAGTSVSFTLPAERNAPSSRSII